MSDVDASTAPRLTGLVVGDEPAAWRALGLPVVGDRCTVGGVTVRLAGAEGARGILGWELEPPPGGGGGADASGEVDGLPSASATGDVPASERADASDDGPSGRGYAVAAVDHVVVATPDVERTTAALGAIGLSPRRTVDAARGDAGVRYRFFLLGTCLLEVIGPVEPDGDGPARFAGLAFTAPDLDVFDTASGPPRDAVQPGRRIVTLRTRDHDVSVPIAVMTPRPASGSTRSGASGGSSGTGGSSGSGGSDGSRR